MKNRTRDLIIHTASELFYEKGYNLTGINEIIEKAGIAKATLYNHFKSKEDLCLAYLDSRDQELLESIAAFCASKEEGDARLSAVLEFLIPFFHTPDFNGCWCIRTMAEVPRENEKIRLKIKTNKNLFRAFIQSLVEENNQHLTAEQQTKLATRIYLLYESAVSESHLQGDAWPIYECLDMLNGLLQAK